MLQKLLFIPKQSIQIINGIMLIGAAEKVVFIQLPALPLPPQQL